MINQSFKEKTAQLLEKADVRIDGDRPWDIQVHNEDVYRRLWAHGSVGFGEAYMDGWWDAESIDELLYRIFFYDLQRQVTRNWTNLSYFLQARFFNLQSTSRAFEVGEAHYDKGNDLYEAMLDKRLTYSGGYWSGQPAPTNLDEAQEAKLDLICRKIGLKAGQTVLDIGMGWGSFAQFAAERHGARVVGVTVSKEQAQLARQRCKGLPIEVRLQDYRAIREQFDHVVSVGMIEHVGYKNYRTYMEVAARSLKSNGFFLLQAIGDNTSNHVGDPWGEKYIFPNSMLPSIKQLGEAIEGLFVMEDWHNFSTDYDKTLMAWFHNFDLSWPELEAKYGQRFYRMWKFYLLSCAGMFRARHIQLWQIVLSKKGVPQGYASLR